MCGRYAVTTAPEAIQRWFKVTGTPPNFPPHYNAAPTQDLPVIRLHPESGERVLSLLRRGLIPYWSKDNKIAFRCINARSETANTAPAFRDAWRRRRCLVPADAFYEWKKIDAKTKQPHAIAMRDRHPFALAGLWENWKDPQTQEWLRTFTIITAKPNEVVAPLHDRMPVIVGPEDYDRWLGEEKDAEALVRPYPSDEMVTWPVSTRVNKPQNDDERILEPIEAIKV